MIQEGLNHNEAANVEWQTEYSTDNLQLGNLCILVAIKTEIKESCSFLDWLEGEKPEKKDN